MKLLRFFCSIIWIVVLWGLLGGIAMTLASAPDWQIELIAFAGAVAMWLYFEGDKWLS